MERILKVTHEIPWKENFVNVVPSQKAGNKMDVWIGASSSKNGTVRVRFLTANRTELRA
jgi:hypothetical protein